MYRFVNLAGSVVTRLSITPGNLIIRSATPIIFIQSSTFMAARLRDYLPASDKILPDRFFLASAPNLQFLSISYYVGNGSLAFAGRFLRLARLSRMLEPRGIFARTFPYY